MAPWNWGNKRQAIIGSAAQIMIEGFKVKNAPPRQDWQDRAWDHIDSIGELGFAVNFISNALSRMDLFPAEKPEQAGDTPVPAENSKALDVFASLDEGYNGGTSSLMGALGQHFPSVGEGHLIGFDEIVGAKPTDGKPAPIRSNYEVLSISELDVKPEGYRRKNEPGAPWDDLPKDTYALRVWRRHPRWSNLAWSPMKPLDQLCHELILRTDSDTAAARSRIANSGILPVPEELEFPAAPDAPDGVDEFTWALVQHMSTAIGDPSHASAVVPLVVRGKAAILAEWAKAGVIKLGRDPDEKDMERRKAIIERIAAGIDLPAEVLLGMGSVNHWGQWAVSEDAFESHIEPFVILALSSLTTGWYRPALQSLGMSVQESRNHLMWFDPSRLVVPADRTKDANEALDRGAIGFKAYRGAGGWSEDDAPTEEDLALMERINKSRPAPTPPTDARDIEPGPPAEGEPASNGAGVRVNR